MMRNRATVKDASERHPTDRSNSAMTRGEKCVNVYPHLIKLPTARIYRLREMPFIIDDERRTACGHGAVICRFDLGAMIRNPRSSVKRVAFRFFAGARAS